MSVTEKGSMAHLDENSKKLLNVAKGLEETLLDYANFKPSKKVQTSASDGKKKVKEEEENANKFRNLIDKIFEFK
jgi:hypothetical protein